MSIISLHILVLNNGFQPGVPCPWTSSPWPLTWVDAASSLKVVKLQPEEALQNYCNNAGLRQRGCGDNLPCSVNTPWAIQWFHNVQVYITSGVSKFKAWIHPPASKDLVEPLILSVGWKLGIFKGQKIGIKYWDIRNFSDSSSSWSWHSLTETFLFKFCWIHTSIQVQCLLLALC